jgi:proline racemase
LISVVSCHTGGEVAKVVVGGLGRVPGDSMFEKKCFMEAEADELRCLLLHEPRGSVIESVNFLFPSSDPEADIGYVIAESTEYPVMSGSNTICVATVVLETGVVAMTEPVTELLLESPAGLIRATCFCEDGKVTGVRFENRPAFVYGLDYQVEVEGLGTIVVDVGWGGMAYALVDAGSVGFSLRPDEAGDLCTVGQRIKDAASEQIDAVHPEKPEFAGITMTEFTGPAEIRDGIMHARNAVIVSPGRVDRSPCGTGTSARLAVMHARGLISVGEKLVHESLLGSRYEAVVEHVTRVGPYPAVVPSITGQAWITGYGQVVREPSDPFPTGYTLSDTWL